MNTTLSFCEQQQLEALARRTGVDVPQWSIEPVPAAQAPVQYDGLGARMQNRRLGNLVVVAPDLWAELGEGAREALMALMITRLAAEPMRETEAQDSATTLNTMGAVVASVTGLSVGHIIRKSMHEDDSLPSRRDVLCSFALAPVGMRAFEDLARFRPRDATHSNLARENDERTFVASWHLHPSEADFTQLGDAVVSWCAQKAPDHTEELESMFKQMRQSMQEEALRLAANDTLPEEVSARQAPKRTRAEFFSQLGKRHGGTGV